jgi:hypothetical protein
MVTCEIGVPLPASAAASRCEDSASARHHHGDRVRRGRREPPLGRDGRDRRAVDRNLVFRVRPRGVDRLYVRQVRSTRPTPERKARTSLPSTTCSATSRAVQPRRAAAPGHRLYVGAGSGMRLGLRHCSEGGLKDTRLSNKRRQGHRTAPARTDRRGRPAAPGIAYGG